MVIIHSVVKLNNRGGKIIQMHVTKKKPFLTTGNFIFSIERFDRKIYNEISQSS